MESTPLAEMERRARAWDEAVLATSEIDRFCSSSAWVLSAHEALMPPRELFVGGGDAAGTAVARGEDPRLGSYIEPLESVWGFASPFVGPDVERAVDDLLGWLSADPDWRISVLSGLAPTGRVMRRVVRTAPSHARLLLAGTRRRQRARLDGGFGAYLARRSRGFRRSLSGAERRADRHGIEFERLDDITDDAAAARAYARVQSVEARSWKGVMGAGIESGSMRGFYRVMMPRLAARGALRLTMGRRDGQDIAYYLGAVFGDTFRGLQQSYDARYREMFVGGLTHARAIEGACAEGLAVYDLGQEAGYKTRWAEDSFETVTLLLVRG